MKYSKSMKDQNIALSKICLFDDKLLADETKLKVNPNVNLKLGTSTSIIEEM